MGWLSVGAAVLVGALAFVYLLPAPPSQQPAPVESNNARGEPLNVPGPIIGARVTGINLDGLTIIPLMHLPVIKIRFTLPLTSTPVKILVSPTLSETVFTTLRLSSINFAAPDPSRQPGNATVSGLTTSMAASVGWKVSLDVGRWNGKTRGSARLAAALANAQLSLALQVVNPAAPRLSVRSTRFDAGEIQRVVLSKTRGSSIATWAIPWIKDTVLLRRPLQWLATYLAGEILESSALDSLLLEGIKAGGDHVDIDMWRALVDEDRNEEILSRIGIAPPLPAPNTSSAPPEPPPLPASVAKTQSFSLQTFLLGPTILHTFPIPSFSPALYRPGGTRELLQSFNLLTGPLSLNCTDVLLSKITFSSAHLFWDADTLELVITLEEFSSTLNSALEISVPPSRMLSTFTKFKQALTATAKTSTLVESRSLQLRFARPPGHSSISPFTTITPTITLPSPLLALGAEMINAITAAAKSQIAVAASIVVGKFVREEVGGWISEGMRKGAEAMDERGIEWSGEIPWATV